MKAQKKTPGGGDREGAEKLLYSQRTNSFVSPQDSVQNFKAAMDKVNLSTKDKIIANGELNRVHIKGDRAGSKNGFYVLYGDGVPAGCFGSWKTGDTIKWCAKLDRELTQIQREQNRRRMIEARKAREAEEVEQRKFARNKALSIWKPASQAPGTHPYLVKKGVKSHGLRLHKKLLVVPMHDSAGNLHSLQFIDGEGNKMFLSGGRKKGCYFAIGVPTESLCIAEGYTTAASVYESTGLPVAVAFDTGNLEPVALTLRAKFPKIKIILCADNDMNTPGNPGVTYARKAALAVDGLLTIAGGDHA